MRFLCALAVLIIAVLMTACSMSGDGTEYSDDQTPYEVDVYMQVPADWVTAENWTNRVMNEIEFKNVSREGYFTNATAAVADLDNPQVDADAAVFTINIKIDSVKQRSSYIKSDLWYRYQTVHMFNPLNVLKPVDGVIYYFGAAWETRMTDVPNSTASRDGNGNYQYIWYANAPGMSAWDWEHEDIVLYNEYANTPMWYGTAVAIAGAVGVIVYFACKKPQKKDIIP